MRRGAMAEGGNDGDRNWSMWLRLLSHSVRDTAGSTSADDTTVLRAVKNLHRLCAKGEQNDDLVGRVYPHLVKIFNRCSASLLSQKASTGLLLLAILQFFLDFGEIVLHDSDPSLRTFFRSCLSRQYADATVAAATLKFLNQNKAKLVVAHPALLPQYYPLLLKLVAWGSSKLDQAFTDLLPALTGPSSFLPLFPALLDLPTLVLALENIQSSSGAAPGTSSGSKKSPAPEVLLALMDEAYTGSVIADSQGDDGAGAKDEPEAFFADLLKDENEGLAKPIMDRVGQLHTSTAKTELALQLCWAIGEHSGGDFGYKAAARELFETLELLLYENLPSSRMKGTDKRNDDAFRESAISQSRLLCSVVTAIAKLATCHRELSPRPRVCLSKVARSQQVLDISIWRSAHEFLGLMHKPAMCSSILGPPSGYPNRPGSVQWSEGGTKAVASIPFYALGEKAGPPFHDFSLQDVIGKSEARSKF